MTLSIRALLLEAIAGHDSRDSTSVDLPVPPYHRNIDEPVKPLRIGVAKEHFGEGLDPEVEGAVRGAFQVYQDLGAEIRPISLPASPFAVAAYYVVATAEASSNLARYCGAHYGHRSGSYDDLIDMYSRSRGEGFGGEVKRRIMLGTYVLSSGYKEAFYVKALKVRRLVKNDFDKAFEVCDVIMGPTAPAPHFRSATRPTTRSPCTCPTFIRSGAIWPASRESAFLAVSRALASRSGCRSSHRRFKRRDCCALLACTNA